MNIYTASAIDDDIYFAIFDGTSLVIVGGG
jgi:hypothetical protein